MTGCICTLDHYDDHRISEILTLNGTTETLVTLAYLSVAYLDLKTDRTRNILLLNESVEIHHMEVRMEYCYIRMGS